MSGSILQLAKRDAKRFVTVGGFQETMMIKTPSGDKSVLLTGFATKHHLSFDSDGLPIDAKNVHVTIDENLFVAAGYPVRNNRGEVALKGHLVSFPDSTGIVKNYIVNRLLPDEVLGLITLILGDYKQ